MVNYILQQIRLVKIYDSPIHTFALWLMKRIAIMIQPHLAYYDELYWQTRTLKVNRITMVIYIVMLKMVYIVCKICILMIIHKLVHAHMILCM